MNSYIKFCIILGVKEKNIFFRISIENNSLVINLIHNFSFQNPSYFQKHLACLTLKCSTKSMQQIYLKFLDFAKNWFGTKPTYLKHI